MKILVVDDEPMTLELLKITLEVQGHAVTAACGGLEAWARFQQEHYPVVISDWMMPHLDGLELCGKIRKLERPRYTFFIILTVREGKTNVLAAMQAGVDDFISKPFDDELLTARLAVASRILALQEERQRMAELVPICAWCKRVRNDQQYWKRVDEWILEATGHGVTHGICPDCLASQRATLHSEDERKP